MCGSLTDVGMIYVKYLLDNKEFYIFNLKAKTMPCKLKLVETQEKSVTSPYGIFSLVLLLIAIYFLFLKRSSYPAFLQSLSPVTIYVFIAVGFINAVFAIIKSISKPVQTGILNIDEVLKKVVIESDAGIHEINFADINRIDIDIRGYKSLTDNLHGNNNFVEFFYNLSTQRERHEFIIESPSDMYIMKNAFSSVRDVNPRVLINY
jgi:hypothetical protein